MELKLPSAVLRTKQRIAEMEAPRLEQPVTTEVTEPVVTAPEPTKPVVSREETVEYWQHRLKTLQGILDAEKSKHREELDSRETKLKAIEESLKEVERRTPKAYDLRKYLLEDEIETLDERQLQAAIRIAVSAAKDELQGEVSRSVAPLQAELENAKAMAQKQREESFWLTLNTNVPNWEQVNSDKGFHGWLNEVDYLTGMKRQSALTNAEATLDASRVAAIFKAFLRERAVPMQNLERKVVPDATTQQPNTNVIDGVVPMTRSEIRQFYNDCRAGHYRGKQKDVDAMERKIANAQSVGAIINQ